MSIRKAISEVATLKVKDVPSHIKPLMTKEKAKGFIARGLENYHKKYFLTDSIAPLLHVCYGGLVFSYLVALPEERRMHMYHEHCEETGVHPPKSIFGEWPAPKNTSRVTVNNGYYLLVMVHQARVVDFHVDTQLGTC